MHFLCAYNQLPGAAVIIGFIVAILCVLCLCKSNKRHKTKVSLEETYDITHCYDCAFVNCYFHVHFITKDAQESGTQYSNPNATTKLDTSSYGGNTEKSLLISTTPVSDATIDMQDSHGGLLS